MVDDLLALVDLGHKKEEQVEALSRGMKQRLCLARTLAHDPQVLILDEPASGLDPRARIEIRELLRELQAMGKTIFFSSHILSEVADICTTIGIIEAGQLVASGDMEAMKKQLRAHRLIQAQVLGDTTPLREFLLRHPAIGVVNDHSEADIPANALRFDFSGDDETLSQLLFDIITNDISIITFSEETGDLEDVFMQVTKGIIN
jgi:ABC-2 type transport system ATP-binding protein